MTKKDARTKDGLKALGAAAIALCLGLPETALAESQRGKPNFQKQSMTRSSAAPTGRSAKPEPGAVATARADPRETTRSSAGVIAKAQKTRFDRQSAHRASGQDAARQSADRSSEPFAGRTTGESPPQAPARAAAPAEPRSSRSAEKPEAFRTADPIETRGPRRDRAKQALVRSPEPQLRAPLPEDSTALAARAKPNAPSVRSAQAPATHLSVRATRGTWIDWLFGR